MNGAITAGMAQFGGVDTRDMWGMPQLGRWKWHDPDVHVDALVATTPGCGYSARPRRRAAIPPR